MINCQTESTDINRQEQNEVTYSLWPFNIVLEGPTNTTEKIETWNNRNKH